MEEKQKLTDQESNSGTVAGYKFWGGELDMPTCNHCGYVFKDEEVFESYPHHFDTSDDGHTETVCPKCGGKLFVTAYTVLKFVMTDEDGDKL